MPAMSTVPPWAQKDIDGFSARYALAHELQPQILDEEAVEIADQAADQTDAAAIRTGRRDRTDRRSGELAADGERLM
jgi:hypothetical protein